MQFIWNLLPLTCLFFNFKFPNYKLRGNGHDQIDPFLDLVFCFDLRKNNQNICRGKRRICMGFFDNFWFEQNALVPFSRSFRMNLQFKWYNDQRKFEFFNDNDNHNWIALQSDQKHKNNNNSTFFSHKLNVNCIRKRLNLNFFPQKTIYFPVKSYKVILIQ